MRSTLLALLFSGAVWAQPQPPSPQAVQSLLGLPEPLSISLPSDVPKALQERVVWQRTLRPAYEGGLENVTVLLLRSPALLSEEKLDRIELDLKQIVEQIPDGLSAAEREQIEKLVEARSPFVRFMDGRRGVIASSKGTEEDAGGASLILPTADRRYELAVYVFGGEADAVREDPDKEFWKQYDWARELRRAAPKFDALMSAGRF